MNAINTSINVYVYIIIIKGHSLQRACLLHYQYIKIIFNMFDKIIMIC